VQPSYVEYSIDAFTAGMIWVCCKPALCSLNL